MNDQIPEDEHLKEAYYYMKAACAEGKIGSIFKSLFKEDCIYKEKEPDEYFYKFYTTGA